MGTDIKEISKKNIKILSLNIAYLMQEYIQNKDKIKRLKESRIKFMDESDGCENSGDCIAEYGNDFYCPVCKCRHSFHKTMLKISYRQGAIMRMISHKTKKI